MLAAQNDSGAKPSQEPSKNIAAEISPLHISFCLFSKFSSSINFNLNIAMFPFGRNDGWECAGDFK